MYYEVDAKTGISKLPESVEKLAVGMRQLSDGEMLNFIDNLISCWRRRTEPHAAYCVDAYQIVREAIFGEVLESDGTMMT